MHEAGLPDGGGRRGWRRRVTERAATVVAYARGRGGEAPLPRAIDPAPNVDGVVEAGFIGTHRDLPKGSTSRLSAIKTGRADFRHPAFRLDSSHGTRQWAKMHAAEAQHAERPEDMVAPAI